MKMKRGYLGALFAIVLLGSCAKQGCTDESADNYNSEAEKDDESCLYGIDLTMYMTDATKEDLIEAEVTPPLSVYIGSTTRADQFVGSVDWLEDSTYAEDPACGETGEKIFNLRFADFTKGTSTVIFRGEYGDGSSAYNIGRSLNLGNNNCEVLWM